MYIKEAHPSDPGAWNLETNKADGVCYIQPRTVYDRLAVAKDFRSATQCAIPLLVDAMDNTACERYGAFPERLCIVERGRIAYTGSSLGPMGFDPEEVGEWLEERFCR